jgi:hypothetical protein
MKSISLFLPILLVFITSFSVKEKLVRKKITSGISVGIPVSFHEMNDDEIADKYYTYRRPLKMFSDEAGVANFGINLSVTPWQDGDIKILYDVYKANIMNTFGNVNMSKSELVTIKNTDFAIFEFTAAPPEDESSTFIGSKGGKSQYHYLAYTTSNGKVAIFNFNCPARFGREWRAIAASMIESIRVDKL